MAGFQTKTWVNRQSEYPTRRKLKTSAEDTGTSYFVERDEGTVSVQGDAFSAANMNDLENRIAAVTTVVLGTLAANATQVSITNNAITSNSILSFYTEEYGFNPSEIEFSGEHTVIIKFDETRESAMQVGVKVEGEYSS